MTRHLPLIVAATPIFFVASTCFGAGAEMPFTTFEAEAGVTGDGAAVVTLTPFPARTLMTPEYEASGRAHVSLPRTGAYVEWANVPAANRIIVRGCVPDAPAGGGASHTLSLYVNGTLRQKLTLTSNHTWLYGKEGENGQSNNPAEGAPHVFWNDERFTIADAPIPEGATVRLQKDADDEAAFYHIDLIDLETAPDPLPLPEEGTYLDVTAAPYNAVPDDGKDDWRAIQRCALDAAAAEPKKIVVIPPGEFHTTQPIEVNGVMLQGSGYWHTRIMTVGKTRAIQIQGDGPIVRELAVFNDTTTRRGDSTYALGAAYNQTTNWTLENCWFQHAGAGIWISGSNHGVARRNRIYNVYASGITLNRGSSHNLVEHNYVRSAGDGGIALISEYAQNDAVNPPSTDNTVRFNTVIANWMGSNMAVSGGGPYAIEDNHFADSTAQSAIGVSHTGNRDFHPLTGVEFRRNLVTRGGGNAYGQRRGAIWIYAGKQEITGVNFSDTRIIAPLFRGVTISAGEAHRVDVTFSNTVIHMASDSDPAVWVAPDIGGSAKFTDGEILGGAAEKFLNPSIRFDLTHSGF